VRELSDFREDITEILRNGELRGQPEWKIEMATRKIIEILMRMDVVVLTPNGVGVTSKARIPEVWENLWKIAEEEGVLDTAAS